MMLNMLRTTEPIERLANGKASGEYAARQFAGWLVFVFVLQGLDSVLAGPNSLLSSYHGVISAAVSILGVAYCYWRTGTKDLVLRFAVLALPVSVQLAIAYEALYWSAYFVYPIAASGLGDSNYDGLWLTYDMLLPLAFTSIWFLRMTQLILRVDLPLRSDE
jgi:hypothetical protein